jgi:hypothetical protein
MKVTIDLGSTPRSIEEVTIEDGPNGGKLVTVQRGESTFKFRLTKPQTTEFRWALTRSAS